MQICHRQCQPATRWQTSCAQEPRAPSEWRLAPLRTWTCAAQFSTHWHLHDEWSVTGLGKQKHHSTTHVTRFKFLSANLISPQPNNSFWNVRLEKNSREKSAKLLPRFNNLLRTLHVFEKTTRSMWHLHVCVSDGGEPLASDWHDVESLRDLVEEPRMSYTTSSTGRPRINTASWQLPLRHHIICVFNEKY